MAIFPNPITQDNFPKAWRCVRRRYVRAKVCAAIRRIAKPVGELLFFPCFLLLAFGTAVSFSTPALQAFLSRLPVVAPLWEQVGQLLFGSAVTVWDYIFRGAAFLYTLPLAGFLTAALLILVIYHPRPFAPSGDLFQDAHSLWTMARHAQTDARSKGGDLGGTLALISGILAALGALFVIFYWLLFPGGEGLLAGIGIENTLRLFLLALILIFAYAPVMFPLGLLMRLISRCPGAQRMAESAEIFCRGLHKVPMAAAPVVFAAAAPVAAEAAAPAPVQAPAEPPVPAPETPGQAPE